MLSKTLILAAAATGLMATAAFAQQVAPSYPDKTLTPPDQVQSATTPGNSLTPSAEDKNNQSNVSATVPISSLPAGSTLTNELVTNGPVPDTKANRAMYGGPQSQAGKATRARGN